jgi:alpha-L-fucosidase
MFDAPGTECKITRTPYSKDIVAQLADACARDGMPLGLYYSPPDMSHPGYRDASRPARENWLGQPERPEWKEYLDAREATSSSTWGPCRTVPSPKEAVECLNGMGAWMAANTEAIYGTSYCRPQGFPASARPKAADVVTWA